MEALTVLCLALLVVIVLLCRIILRDKKTIKEQTLELYYSNGLLYHLRREALKCPPEVYRNFQEGLMSKQRELLDAYLAAEEINLRKKLFIFF